MNNPSSSSTQGTSASASATLLANAPAARLCHLVRWPEYDGYGFKLVAAQQGNLPRVTAVESGSPAEAAGLRANDTVVEVNGAILEGLGHQDVVQLVKSTPNEARLLVVDDETAAWYKRHGITLRGDLLSTIRVSSKASSRKFRKKDGTTSSRNQSSSSMTSSVNAVSVENRSYQEIMWRIGKEADQVDLLVIDRETDEAFASREQKPSGQADGVLRRWTPVRPPRSTFRKTKKQTPVVKAGSTGGLASPQAIGASLRPSMPSTANDASHGLAASSEHLVAAEDVTKSDCRPHLPTTQPVLLNCASPIATPRSGTYDSGHTSISVGSSESVSRAPSSQPMDNRCEARLCFTIFAIVYMALQEPSEGLRLCHLSKWPNFEGYGFAVNADRYRNGQFVAHVDVGGPAHLGGLRKRDRIVEVNGESVEGASYRDVVNRIKVNPDKVALLVIDRETDEAFARQGRTPNSQEDCVVECRTPPEQPQSYARASGFRSSVYETPRVPIKSDASTVVPGETLNDGSTAAGKSPGNQLTNSFWPVKPASESVPLLVARPMMLVCPESRQHEDEAASLRGQQAKHQPAKSEPRAVASKPFPSLYTIKESPSPPTEPYDNGSPPRSPTRSAADYFPAHDVCSAHTSTQFTPPESHIPTDYDSPHYSPPRPILPTAKRTFSAPSSAGYASSQPCGPYCPAQSWLSTSFQAPYVPLETDLQQERTTTYAPGYSEFLSMYSGYASSAPLKSATETTSAGQTPTERHCAEDVKATHCNVMDVQSGLASRVVSTETKHRARSPTNEPNDDKFGAKTSDKN
ncbi:hypothetical protein HPB52_010192 [Rhipicephalus sanguineus]|uniref:PDZ domain-containing protein n=1 Tax=Rhipicephalus sanguineus TaxID=34632 RepID=A0A9D4SY77_RHISA|nr:hypothetical protein HPB52_010192 [Rhipicephalus sanguineus]